MEFQTAAQRICYEKTAPWMTELFGEFAQAHPDMPAFATYFGSAIATTTICPWGSDDATITTRSFVVQGAELTPDLMRYLLQKNAEMRFGAFGVDDDRRIVFEHSLIGSTCDKTELKMSVLAVVNIADHYDDEIVKRWGGVRALDLATRVSARRR